MATAPRFVANWYQPVSLMPTWKARHVNLAIGWERQDDANGNPTMPLVQWQGGVIANGGKYVRTFVDRLTDSQDPNLFALLAPDELDDQVINAQDRGDAAAEEAVYAGLEALHAEAKLIGKPLWANFDGGNFRWRKADYKRLFAACDLISVDYYPIQRGEPISTLAEILDAIQAFPGGAKLTLAWVETSYQELDPAYFKGGRAPMVDEFNQLVKVCTDRGLSVGYFSQAFGKDGKSTTGFRYDATPPEIVAAMASVVPVAGAVSATTGTSTPPVPPVPVPTPTATPTVTPSPAVPPQAWTLYRDVHNRRWSNQLPPLVKGKPNRYVLVTDPADIATLDRIAAKYPPR
jgi:hypothetical protein